MTAIIIANSNAWITNSGTNENSLATIHRDQHQVRTSFLTTLGIASSSNTVEEEEDGDSRMEVDDDDDIDNITSQQQAQHEELKCIHPSTEPEGPLPNTIPSSPTRTSTSSSVSFSGTVHVRPIPSHRYYDATTKSNLWNGVAAVAAIVRRNTIEYTSEGWNLEGVLEEDAFVQTNGGELVHPATYQQQQKELRQRRQQKKNKKKLGSYGYKSMTQCIFTFGSAAPPTRKASRSGRTSSSRRTSSSSNSNSGCKVLVVAANQLPTVLPRTARRAKVSDSNTNKIIIKRQAGNMNAITRISCLAITVLVVLMPATTSGFTPLATVVGKQSVVNQAVIPSPFHQQHHQHQPWTLSSSNGGDDYSYGEEEKEDAPSTSSSPAARGRRRRPIRLMTPKTDAAEQNRNEAQLRHEQALQDPTLLTNVQFQEREDIHPATKRALIEVMGLQSMTEIQLKTYAESLSGRSVLARSRTGTGKTLAFLLPALERILANEQRQFHPGRNVGVLVVAPTRELAIQISEQAKDLVQFHNTGGADLSVLCLYGGTKIQKDIGLLNQKIPTILVCTPGRLQDHLKDTRLRGRKFSDVMEETSILVLDETDSLLKSFAREMKTIISFLPRSNKRQTLLFSATLPPKMKQSFAAVLPEDYSLVDCVDKNNVKAETNRQVEQTYVVLDSMEKYISALVSLVLHFFAKEGMAEKNKMMVFLPTTRLVSFFSELFTVGIQQKDLKVFQLHSKMSQSARNRVSNEFRTAKRGVLFTTDVSARGMDYPDISVVLQYGAPNTQEEYIHRVGRTGRAGNQGQGILVLLPFEQKILKGLKDRGIAANYRLGQMLEDLPSTYSVVEPARKLVSNGHRVLLPASETAYLSLLAYYSSRADFLGLSSKSVLDLANCFAKQSGLEKTPEMSESLASDLNLDSTSPKLDDISPG